MGLFDWFEPDPAIRCLKCKTGMISGWQGKHSGHALFLWRQGIAAPTNQLIDEECKIDVQTRDAKRLPVDEGVSIYYGDCDSCGAIFPFHLELEFTGDTWTGFAESKVVKYAEQVQELWLRCPDCLTAFELAEGHFMVMCSDCKILLIRH